MSTIQRHLRKNTEAEQNLPNRETLSANQVELLALWPSPLTPPRLIEQSSYYVFLSSRITIHYDRFFNLIGQSHLFLAGMWQGVTNRTQPAPVWLTVHHSS